MAYLTSNEFKQFGYSPPDDDTFKKVEQAAELIINGVTVFYDPDLGSHILAADASSSINFEVQRATAFKKAVAMQTQFLIEANANSAYQLQQSNLSSYSVGNTSMTFKTGAIDTMTSGSTGLLNSARLLLGRYGLLYAGVDHS
ncbi:hypothetical protein KBX49_09070 [Liquorilactobacillus satsumensis]|uniref:hypothetical protein n=1 Tax=Liquorilactobacillus satsumensis TaxID=259059 RepID=UPI0021C29ACB|nr:hypothetical protein [Liquorilactobacillus satsumensis]MCP9357377.1 hypothetical protein [Liquorilactobacillus satsumensis]MCP9372063.1 hypothetical protein [Liquorilactobacillus satsumensis]